MIRPVTLALLLLVACGGRAPAAQPLTSTAGVSTTLLAHVPADTPYLVHFDAQLFSLPGSAIDYRKVLDQIAASLTQAVLPPEQLAAAEPGARFVSELARELMPLDVEARAKVGWLAGKSGGAVYGLGLVPVLRVRVDGPKARAALVRVLERAKVPFTEARWQEVPYLVIAPFDADSPPLVVVAHADQLVASFVRDPAVVLPHLTARAPLAASVADRDPHRTDPDSPADATLVFLLEPARAAARLRAGTDVAALTTEQPEPRCLAAITTLLDKLPAFTSTYWLAGDSYGAAYAFEVSDETARLLASGHGVPHWLADHAHPRMQMALGVPVAALEAPVRKLVASVTSTATACGEDAPDPFPDVLRELGPFAHATGGTFVMEFAGGQAGMGALVEVPDVAGAWGWIARQIPVGPMPPIGEIRGFPPGSDQVHVMVAPRTLAGSTGTFGADRLRALVDSEGRPDAIAAMQLDAAAVAAYQGGATLMGSRLNQGETERQNLAYDSLLLARIVGTTLVIRGEFSLPRARKRLDWHRAQSTAKSHG